MDDLHYDFDLTVLLFCSGEISVPGTKSVSVPGIFFIRVAEVDGCVSSSEFRGYVCSKKKMFLITYFSIFVDAKDSWFWWYLFFSFHHKCSLFFSYGNVLSVYDTMGP